MQAIQGYQVGGVILFGRNVESAEQLAALTNGLKELNGDYVPLFLCVDQEGGRVDRMPPEVSRTPSAWSVGQTLDTEGVGAAYGALLAEECAAFGFNMDFAPSLDIWSNPDNTVIGDRAFGNDWEWTAFFGMSAVEGMEKQGTVIPVVKHFPGHGDTAVDSHTALPVVDKTLEDLWQSELVPFDMVLSGQFWGEPVMEPTPAVMVAHILLSQIDPDNPASLSPEVVTGLLREEMGYEGVVCTDDLTMGGHFQHLRYGGGRRTGRGGRVRSAAGVPRGGQPGRGPRRPGGGGGQRLYPGGAAGRERVPRPLPQDRLRPE